jgi:N-acetyl-anhydromuramyl-L-alanine amidase AmpD
MKLRSLTGLALISLLLDACGGDASSPPGNEAPVERNPAGTKNDAFARAAAETGVPRDLLVAIAYTQSRLGTTTSEEPAEARAGHVGAELTGLFRLDSEQVRTSAALIGVPEASVHDDPETAIRASAALILSYANEHAGAPHWLSWDDYRYAAARVARLVPGTPIEQDYADEIAIVLGDGLDVTTPEGERIVVSAQIQSELMPNPIEVPPSERAPASLEDGERATVLGEYPAGIVWYPAHPNNQISGRGGGTVKYVVIHDIEGTYWSAIDWFQQANPFQSSAHYIIRSSDGQIAQMVSESNTAWHAGNDYYSRNSIGIEHEGYASNPSYWFTEAMYQSSAKLVCALAVRYGIPVDRQHIIGHYQIPDPYVMGASAAPGTNAQTAGCYSCYGGVSQHTDPGPNGTGWKWDYFMSLVKGCVDGTGGGGSPPPASTLNCSGSACWPSAELKAGDQGKMVYLLQQDLVYLGHLDPTHMLTGPGIFGSYTKAAVSDFQAKKGLVTSGNYDAKTAAAMETALKARPPDVPAQNLVFGTTSQAVATLQARLTSAGYAVPSTGYYGTITQSNVLAFQQARGTPGADGGYGALTRMALAGRLQRGY